MPAPLSETLEHVPGRVRAVAWPWDGLAVVAGQAALFFPLAALRFVDGDEGSYLLAARLAGHGQLPYRDFGYPQMPLLPYVYGGWTRLVGESWYAARFLSALLAVALGTLLYRHLAARFGRRLGLVGLLLYASSSLVVGWFTVAKTYALSSLLLFAAVALVDRDEPATRRRFLAAGALVGLAIDTRLLFAAAVPAFAWAALRKRGLPALASLAGGGALGLAPALAFLAIDPRRFIFENLGAHALRSSGGLVGDLPQKAKVAANLVGVGATEGAAGAQLLLLLVLMVAAAAVSRRLPLPFLVAGLLALASFMPTPTYAQYFCVLVPLLAAGSVELLAGVRTRLPSPELARALAALVAVYVGLASVDLYRYAARTPFAGSRIADVERVTAVVDANTRPGERVLASWPGYLFGSHAASVRGLENDYAPHEGARMTPAEAHRYGMMTVADVEGTIRDRRTRLVVFRLWQTLPPVPDWQGALRAGRYRLLAQTGSARIYTREEG